MNTKLMAMGLAAAVALFGANAMACEGMQEADASEPVKAVVTASNTSTEKAPAKPTATKTAKGKAAPTATKTASK